MTLQRSIPRQMKGFPPASSTPAPPMPTAPSCPIENGNKYYFENWLSPTRWTLLGCAYDPTLQGLASASGAASGSFLSVPIPISDAIPLRIYNTMRFAAMIYPQPFATVRTYFNATFGPGVNQILVQVQTNPIFGTNGTYQIIYDVFNNGVHTRNNSLYTLGPYTGNVVEYQPELDINSTGWILRMGGFPVDSENWGAPVTQLSTLGVQVTTQGAGAGVSGNIFMYGNLSFGTPCTGT